MISVKPFAALRPPRDKAYLVATRSYLDYSEEELSDKLENNPYTFLHVINPYSGKKLKFGKKKYGLVKDCFQKFSRQGVYFQDDTENFYLYRQVKEGREFIGIIGGVSVQDYWDGRIKKHEKTLTRRETMFTDYLETTGFNAEPVLLTHSPNSVLQKLFEKYKNTRSEYEFTSTDRVLHQLWLISEKDDIDLIINELEKENALYIADGHHRSASSARLAKRFNENGKSSDGHNYFMAYLIAEDQLQIFDFNRLIKGLHNLSVKEFINILKKDFDIKKSKNPKPKSLHHFAMYLDKNWCQLILKKQDFKKDQPVKSLDAHILSEKILKPILGIENLKTDRRAAFLPGTEGLEGLQRKVDSGEFDIAFALYPVQMEQLKAVADAGKTMPPKSTYIEPKLRSGLTVYQIDS